MTVLLACWRSRGQVDVAGAEGARGGRWREEVESQWESDLAGPCRIFFRVRWESLEILSRGVE